MRTIRLYLPAALSPGALVPLDENAARHALGVLRLRAGARFVAFDGAGGEFDATLESASRRAPSARIGEAREACRESPLDLTLALGVSRGGRMDIALQKATELGVTRIVPVLTARSVVKFDDKRAAERLRHWQQVVASACEQCGRSALPEVRSAARIEAFLGESGSATRLVLDPGAERGLDAAPRASAATVLVGPEGGFDARELEQAREAGFVGVQVGPRILRTETAAIVAVTALQLLHGDLAIAACGTGEASLHIGG